MSAEVPGLSASDVSERFGDMSVDFTLSSSFAEASDQASPPLSDVRTRLMHIGDDTLGTTSSISPPLTAREISSNQQSRDSVKPDEIPDRDPQTSDLDDFTKEDLQLYFHTPDEYINNMENREDVMGNSSHNIMDAAQSFSMSGDGNISNDNDYLDLEPSPNLIGEPFSPSLLNRDSHYHTATPMMSYYNQDQMLSPSADYYNGNSKPFSGGICFQDTDARHNSYAEPASANAATHYNVNTGPYDNFVFSSSTASMYRHGLNTAYSTNNASPNTEHVQPAFPSNVRPVRILTESCNPKLKSFTTGANSSDMNPYDDIDQHDGQGSQQIQRLQSSLMHKESSMERSPFNPCSDTVSLHPISSAAAGPTNFTPFAGEKLEKMASYVGFHNDYNAAFNYMWQTRRTYEVGGQDDWQMVEANPVPFVRDIYEAMSTLVPQPDTAQISYWNTMTRKGHEQAMLEARAWDIIVSVVVWLQIIAISNFEQHTAITQHKYGISNFPELEINKRDPLDISMRCSDRLLRIRDILYVRFWLVKFICYHLQSSRPTSLSVRTLLTATRSPTWWRRPMPGSR